MLKSKNVAAALFLFALHTTACSSHFSRGVHAFNDGCFVEAIAQLSQDEHKVAEMSDRDRIRYCLYRGLTHLSLADMASAELWIRHAKRLYDSDRNLLGNEDEGRLRSAWQSLGYDAGQWGEQESDRHASGPFARP
jgi:hypothetical protein